ncbi:VWA domain-containing protein [bacterium]|nr:VWA domain-containing protein [bacterium]
MKKFLIIFSIIFCTTNIILANDNYNLYNYDAYKPNLSQNEKILFIMDYSNSMNEFLGGGRKIDLMRETMREILPAINSKIETGLRVYGHRLGFTAYECCKASKLAVPIQEENIENITAVLENTKARGMTPITYSLKKAVNNDFNGFQGKKHIILLSDGGENCDESPCDYVMKNLAKQKDFTIDVIAFNINNKDDLNQLKCISTVTSGKFYTANTKGELVNALNNTIRTTKEVGGVIIKD